MGKTVNYLALGLGANLGDRLKSLRTAVRHIKSRQDILLVSASDVFESAPWGVEEQPSFLNACITIATQRSPQELLDLLKEIEHVMGRQVRGKWERREIDLDILLSKEGTVIQEDRLTIPHAFLAERAFVLCPLAQIAPEWSHPLLGRSILELQQRVDCSEIRRITTL